MWKCVAALVRKPDEDNIKMDLKGTENGYAAGFIWQ
jgi:hypothetical protein